ncbi:MAG: hypothetical protein HYZ00_03200 [Candidatus Hydrogenedentes bacterium]|nr:hypothetical protein [Candidatus Hydrogenedentota bacterium]
MQPRLQTNKGIHTILAGGECCHVIQRYRCFIKAGLGGGVPYRAVDRRGQHLFAQARLDAHVTLERGARRQVISFKPHRCLPLIIDRRAADVLEGVETGIQIICVAEFQFRLLGRGGTGDTNGVADDPCKLATPDEGIGTGKDEAIGQPSKLASVNHNLL